MSEANNKVSNTSDGLHITHMLAGSPSDSDSERDTVFFDDVDEDNPKKEISAQPMIFFDNRHQATDEEAPAVVSYATSRSSTGSSKSGVDNKMSGTTQPKSQNPPDPSKGHSTLVIQHIAAPSTHGGAAFFLGMTKPVFAIIAFSLLFTTASAIVFFTQFLRIPGLDNQIAALTTEVDRLESQLVELEIEIDRLSSEVDRLGSEVDSLSSQNDRLASENDRLEIENDAFNELNQKLNGTSLDLVELLQSLSDTSDNLLFQVSQLTIENDILRNSTGSLETQVINLQDQTETLNTTNAELNATSKILEAQNAELVSDIVLLNGTNNALLAQNNDLNATLTTLGQQNSDLNDQVGRLESVLSFLNETTGNGTFDELIQTISGLIETNRNLALTSLQTQYLVRSDNWLCDYLTDFSGKAFIDNPNLGIGESDYPSVISNVELGAMDPLCLDTDNFEDFVSLNYEGAQSGASSPSNVTTNQLRSAIKQYTTKALNHYFPDQGETGVSPQNWTEAGYDCKGFPSILKFTIDLT